MKTLVVLRLLTVTASVALAGPAFAIVVADQANARSPVASPVQAATSPAQSSPTLVLARGRVDGLELSKGEIVLSGKPMRFDPKQLRVVGAGGQRESGAAALRKGMTVRFALDPASAAAERGIVLIYIDR